MDVKSIIKAHGFTLASVAKQMGILPVTLTQTLSESGNPTRKTLQRIADIIGCKVGDFFADEITDNKQGSAPAIICPHCGKTIYLTTSTDEP